ncbi:hypothetical protein BH11PAT1_BH11PAT1_2270 [soil metagenome]
MANEHTNTTHGTHFPPVVGVLGHVDHGKTSLLDAIRSTSIADREYGGITQKIGASTVEIEHDGQKRRITFIDTPGHEAFRNMRSQGAQAADIGLLIVSAVDGVMPQTKESITLLKEAKIPFIVVLTKVDLPTKNVEKVKQEILREEVMLEGLGGDIPVMEVSAKAGTNVKELLDLILLIQEMHPKEGTIGATEPLEAIVIESKRDSKSGAKATVIVKNGTIRLRDEIQSEGEVFRVRMLSDERSKPLQEATVGDGIEVLGMQIVPSVGAILTNKKDFEKKAHLAPQMQKDMVYQPMKKDDELNIIICADTEGSLEALSYSFPEKVNILSKKTGEVSEADILLAKSTGALVLSFNSRIRPDVQKLAITEKVLARNYNIIYEMIDEVKDVLEGKRLALVEEIFGVAQVLAKFPFEKTFVIGVKITDGRVARGDKVRIMRGDEVVGEGTLSSLRVGKNSISKVEKGHEAGLILTPLLDFQVGDVIICHS